MQQDFFSDVFFCALLYTDYISNPSESDLIYLIIFGLSAMFIVVPVLLNFRDLLKFQKKWQSDKLHADRYRAWLSQYVNVLFFLSFLSGSTFGAIAFVNSNFLGLRLFAMGLSSRDLREFNQRRLRTVVVAENLPQLLLQIAFTAYSTTFSLVAFLAICSSSLSIAAAFFSFAANKNFLKDKSVQESLFRVKVSCSQPVFLKKLSVYKNKTYVLATEIARIFPLDRNAVEILPTEKFSDKTSDGLMLYFFVATSKKQPMEIKLSLEEACQCNEKEIVSHLGKQIARAWNLKYAEQCDKEQQVKTYDLKFLNQDDYEQAIQVVSSPTVTATAADQDDEDDQKQDTLETNGYQNQNAGEQPLHLSHVAHQKKSSVANGGNQWKTLDIAAAAAVQPPPPPPSAPAAADVI